MICRKGESDVWKEWESPNSSFANLVTIVDRGGGSHGIAGPVVVETHGRWGE